MNEWRSQQKLIVRMMKDLKDVEVCGPVTEAAEALDLTREAIDLDPTQLDEDLEPCEAEEVLLETVKDEDKVQLKSEELFEDYSPDPVELEIFHRVMDTEDEADEGSAAQAVMGSWDLSELTQPAPNTQASQERLLLPENRGRLGKRFARSQMALCSTQMSEYDSQLPHRTYPRKS